MDQCQECLTPPLEFFFSDSTRTWSKDDQSPLLCDRTGSYLEFFLKIQHVHGQMMTDPPAAMVTWLADAFWVNSRHLCLQGYSVTSHLSIYSCIKRKVGVLQYHERSHNTNVTMLEVSFIYLFL